MRVFKSVAILLVLATVSLAATSPKFRISQLKLDRSGIKAYFHVSNLATSDVDWFLDDQPLKIRAYRPFASTGEAIHSWLLVDTTVDHNRAVAISQEFAKLAGKDDRFQVMRIAAEPIQQTVAPVAAGTGLEETIARLGSLPAVHPSQGRTDLYRGIVAALEGAETSENDRHIVVVVTDGFDFPPEGAARFTPNQVIEHARTRNVPIYAFGIKNERLARNGRTYDALCVPNGGISGCVNLLAFIAEQSGGGLTLDTKDSPPIEARKLSDLVRSAMVVDFSGVKYNEAIDTHRLVVRADIEGRPVEDARAIKRPPAPPSRWLRRLVVGLLLSLVAGVSFYLLTRLSRRTMLALSAIGTEGEHQELRFRRRAVVGTSFRCNVRLDPSTGILRRHCEIRPNKNGFVLKKLNGEALLAVDGVPIPGPCMEYAIGDDARVRFGLQEFRIMRISPTGNATSRQ